MPTNDEPLGKRRRSMDPQTCSSDNHEVCHDDGRRSKRRYSCPEPSLRSENCTLDCSLNLQKISMMRVLGQMSHSSRVNALREEKRQEIQNLCVPQNIKKVRNFWKSNLESTSCSQEESTKVIKRSRSVDSSSGNNKKYKPQLFPKPSLSKEYLSRHHSVPTTSSITKSKVQENKTQESSAVPTLTSPLESPPTLPVSSPTVFASTPMLRVEVDDSPSACQENAIVDVFAEGRLSPVSPRARRRQAKSDSIVRQETRSSSEETSNFNDFVDNMVDKVLVSVLIDVSTSSQLSQEFEEDTYLNNLVSTIFRTEDPADPPEEMVTDEGFPAVSRSDDLDSFADGLVSQVLNDFFAEQSSEKQKRQEVLERRKSSTRSDNSNISINSPANINSRSPSYSPELLSTKDRYKASRCKPIVPAEIWRIRRQRSFGHDLSDSEPDLMDLDTNSLEMFSSTGDFSCDVISNSDVITYADKLSDEIIEEVFKMLSFHDDDEDLTDDDDTSSDDDDDDGPGDNDPLGTDDNDSDKGESDVYEFADEYVTNIISSVMTEVSMTTDSGVEELCEDDINLDVMARYIVEDVIHEALNIVRRDNQPTSPAYGQLVVKDNGCYCVPSRVMTSQDLLMSSQDMLMTSGDSLIISPESVLSRKESPKYGTLIILDDMNKDPLDEFCCKQARLLTRQNSNSLPSLITPLTTSDTRTKSCSDLTGTSDPVLRNLTELCKSLGVSDTTSTSPLDRDVLTSEGDGALFDQQLIDCLKPGTSLNAPKNGAMMRSQYITMSPVPPSVPPRSSTEAIYENSLDVVIKHAREVEQKKKKKKKRENSMRRRVRPGVSLAKQKSLRRNRRNLRLVRRASSRKKKVVEYSNESSPCIPSSYCNLPSIKQTFFVAQNTVPKYLSEISYENMVPKDVLKPTSISMKRYASFSMNRDISPFVRAEYEGLKKVEQAEKGPPPPPLPPPVEKVVQIGKPAEEEEDDYNDPDDRQDLPVIVPTNVSVDESHELSELYCDDYDEMESIFNRPLPTPATPEPKIEINQQMDEGEEDEDSHYYESGNVPDEDEEENHLYDDITEYHRVCDLDHEKNGYESVGAGAEVDYTGIDDYNSVNGSEDEEEVDRELEEVDVSDLQVEEVELNIDLYGDDYGDGESLPTVDPLTNHLPCSPPTSPCTDLPSLPPGLSPSEIISPGDLLPPVTSSSSSSLRTSSLHLYDNQLPELQDHFYYNLSRRSHSISTGSSSLPREHESFHSAMSHNSIFSSSGSRSSSTKSFHRGSLPRTSPTMSHYDTPPIRHPRYENSETRKFIMSWHGTNDPPPSLSSSQARLCADLSRDLQTTTSQPTLLGQLPPYNLSRRSSTSPFTSTSDNNMLSHSDLPSSLSFDDKDEEGYLVPMTDSSLNQGCDEDDEHCYELIGEDNNHLEQDSSHLYEFISEHIDQNMKPVPAPIRTSTELTEDELYEDIEASTPSYRTELEQSQYETLGDPAAGSVTPETPTVTTENMWLARSQSPKNVVSEDSSCIVTSHNNVMTSPDNSLKSENVVGPLRAVNGGGNDVSQAKSPLRRVSAGRAQCQLTSEELSKLKRATFIPPPPPPSSREISCHRPRSPCFSSSDHSTSRHVTSPVSLSRRSSSFVSEASSSGQTDDKESGTSSSDESHVSDIEEEAAEISPDSSSLIIAEALWDHLPLSKDHLEFSAGDLIEVLQQNGKWWRGRTDSGNTGWFPADSVRLRISQEADEQELHQEKKSPRKMTIMQRMSSMSGKQKLNPEWVRQKVIEEIINYEEGYVKNLADVIEGPLKEARLRKDIFDTTQIERLFNNIEELFEFQVKFLESLKKRLKAIVHKSEIGDTFTEHQEKFVDIYSRYCNNHSSALAEYTILNQHMVYTIFFESCRLLKDMESIPLDGYLLKPVQRICQYQLQLKELLKYTSPSHPDHAKVKEAECIMSSVASTVNERKRRTENINKLALWQSSIEDWRGEDILVKSSIMIHSGSLYKISAGNKQLRRFFLFDRQLVYCRKLLGSGKLQYKGRINLDQCQTVDLEDNSEPGIVNGWKMENQAKNKWIVLFSKNNTDKSAWINALKEERKQVELDSENNFVIPEAQKHAAYVQVRRSNSTRSKKQNSFSQKYKSTSDLRSSLLADKTSKDVKSKSNKKLKGFSNKMFLKKQKKLAHLHD
ncbi:hypothetical protein ACHWQZ_G018871 [Mnemiopsis leidyi]